jgi:hypothetical protein
MAARQTMTLHFRSVEHAQRFVDAFPELELADGTKERWYTSPEFPHGRHRAS